MLSTILHILTAFVAAHPGGAAWVVATLVAIYRSRTPEQWIALGESNPRLQGLFKMSRGAGFEPARVLEGAAQVVTGQRVPDPRELVIASQAEELTRLREALAALQRRVSESHAVTQPMGDPTAQANGSRAGSPPAFDPTARITRAELPQGLAHPAQMFAPSFDPHLTQDVTEAAHVARQTAAEPPANDPKP